MALVLEISPRRCGRALLWTSAAVSVVGVAAELLHATTAAPDWLRALLSLSYEDNFPTWYSSLLLAACASLLAVCALHARRVGAPHPRRWALLSAWFFYMSLDEAIELHEHLGGLFHLHGVLHFSWVVPASIVVAGLGAFYLPFLRALPARTRWRFVIAGAIYVGGALLMELPLGWWAERAGDDNLVYALLDALEESMELVGASLFVAALLDYLALRGVVLRLGEEPAA